MQRIFLTTAIFAAAMHASVYAQDTNDASNTDEQTAIPLYALASGETINSIEFIGLERVPPGLISYQIRSQEGDSLSPETVKKDLERLYTLGRFSAVTAHIAAHEDGGITLVYHVVEFPLLRSITVLNNDNDAVDSDELLVEMALIPGDPADQFLIDKAIMLGQQLYADEGYYNALFDVDEEALASGDLIFSITEGERTRVRDIRFEGNDNFHPDRLKREITSREYTFILTPGFMEREKLTLDAASLQAFYQSQGYLEARVGRRIDVNANGLSCAVTFMIDEGPLYQVRKTRVRYQDLRGTLPEDAPHVFANEQIRRHMLLQQGSHYRQQDLDQSQQLIEDMYGTIGYINTRVDIDPIFVTRENNDAPYEVDLVVSVYEGGITRAGITEFTGNTVTRQRVGMHLLAAQSIEPGRRVNGPRLNISERSLAQSPYFASADLSFSEYAHNDHRDIVIEVEEKQTGEVTFGVGVNSDLGVSGNVGVTQRNFDIMDTPTSWDDFLSRQAFRGNGQTLSVQASPGTEYSQYSVSLTEPHLLESDTFLSAGGSYSNLRRTDWDEERMSGRVTLGQRIGAHWSISASFKAESIDIGNFQPEVPIEVMDVKGGSLLTTNAISLSYSNVDSGILPTSGYKHVLSLEQIGLMGGDYNFSRIHYKFFNFWTLNEDFLGRRSVLSFRGEAGYILQENKAPFFENFYAGGQTNFRGFKYRGIGPRGTRADTLTPSDLGIGDRAMLLARLQYEEPLIGDMVRWAVFTDQGTVQPDLGFDDWRITVGAGLRFKIPFLGQAPLAIDFAVPILDEEEDQARIFSFSFSVPLQ